MTQHRFPRHFEHWQAQVEALISQLETDRDRLMKTLPQTPEQTGIALAGPLDPTTFNFGAIGTASGSVQSGTALLSGPGGSGAGVSGP